MLLKETFYVPHRNSVEYFRSAPILGIDGFEPSKNGGPMKSLGNFILMSTQSHSVHRLESQQGNRRDISFIELGERLCSSFVQALFDLAICPRGKTASAKPTAVEIGVAQVYHLLSKTFPST